MCVFWECMDLRFKGLLWTASHYIKGHRDKTSTQPETGIFIQSQILWHGTAHQDELTRHTHLGKIQFPSKAGIFLEVHDLLRFSSEEGNLGTRSQAGPVPAPMAGLLPHSAGGSGLMEILPSQGSPQLTLNFPQYLPVLQLKILFLRRTYWFGRGLEDEAAYLCPDSPTWQKSCISCGTCYHSQCHWHFFLLKTPRELSMSFWHSDVILPFKQAQFEASTAHKSLV